MTRDLTVVMPLWNATAYVADAVGSVLDGADGLLELLVVDDGSTDDGPAVAAAFGGPVRVISQTNAGPAAARNRGLAEARGELVAFLDADDRWTAGRPDPRRTVLDADPALGGVMGRVQPVIATPGGVATPFRTPVHSVHLQSLLLRRAIVEEHGALDPERRFGEDVEWLMRLRDEGVRIARVDDVVVHYRLRAGSLTRDVAATKRGLVHALRASLERRGMVG